MRDEDERKVLEKELKRWEETTLRDALASHPERRKEFVTTSSRPVKRLYSPLDLAGKTDRERLGSPGEFPYTRGIHPTMYRGRLWTMRMFAGYGSAEDTNRRFKYLISHGETGLSVAVDMPTLYGYDTDEREAKGEFGTCGVAGSSLDDMKILFRGIEVGDVSTSMTINTPASVIWAMYLVMAEDRGVAWTRLRGTIQNDILKEYQAQKEWIYPPEPSMRLVVDTFEFGTKQVPGWNTISISGYHIREAGATAAQELAFTLANGFTYVERGVARGLDVDALARRIWARHMRERFHAKSPRSWMMRFHAQTAGVTLTAQQPMNNVVRVAYQALAAVLGGTQSLHTNSLDETLALPTEEAVRLALRTQQIIAHETGVPDVIDPLGGSYYLETLTDQLEREAEALFAEIQSVGGVVKGIEGGWFQRQIARAAEAFQRDVEAGGKAIVGVNEFTNADDHPVEILKVSNDAEGSQRRRLARLRAERDGAVVRERLGALRRAALEDRNVIGPMLDCARAYCTLYEIRHALESVYGAYREPVFF